MARITMIPSLIASRHSPNWRPGYVAPVSTKLRIVSPAISDAFVHESLYRRNGTNWRPELGSLGIPCARCGLIHSHGLGTVTAQSINSLVTTGAESTISILASLHAVIGGVAMAGPIGAAIAAVIAVASLLVSAFGVGSGCGQSCIIASNDANKVEQLLQQNLQAYLSSPVHYKSLQQAALNNFDTVWNMLVKACSDPSLGDAGKRCISDRQSGSCKYHTSPGGWQNGTYVYPGANGSGSACWDWFIGYRSPISDDPTVVSDPSPSGAIGTGNSASAVTAGISSGSTTPLLLIAAGGALLLWGLS